jgi:hypothetical protein
MAYPESLLQVYIYVANAAPDWLPMTPPLIRDSFSHSLGLLTLWEYWLVKHTNLTQHCSPHIPVKMPDYSCLYPQPELGAAQCSPRQEVGLRRATQLTVAR